MQQNFRTHVLSAAMLCACGVLGAMPAGAVEFQAAGADITFSTVISAGLLIRAEDPSGEFYAAGNRAGGFSSTSAYDDPSLNFKKGEIVSNVYKIFSELKVDYGDFGGTLSAKAWYDHELDSGDRRHGNIVNGYAPGRPLSDRTFDDLAKFKGFALMDAYVRGKVEVGDMPLELRLGRQVVSWGEGLFIGGGINSINPIDVSAFRRPGAELKEGLLPVEMAYGNIGLTGDLSFEAFYQLKWAPTVIDGCGTYFSTVDSVAKGCNGFTLSAAQSDPTGLATGNVAKRADDLEARDDGQFGFALRYYAAALDVELSAYYMRYHSRVPYISIYNTTAANGGAPFINGDPLGGNFRYVIEFPEDINLFGLGFSTVLGGVSVFGEASYRPDMPVQLNANHLLAAFRSGGTSAQSPLSPAVAVGSGALFHGYDEAEQYRAQVAAFKLLPPALGAAGITLIGEVGFEVLDGLPGDRRYGRTAVYGLYNRSGTCAETTARKCADDGYVTDFSWGYRARGVLDYPDAVLGWNMKPFLSWAHDVNGTASDSTYLEGRMALGLGVDFDSGGYSFGTSYVRFMGGDYNYGKDRDFVSINATARF
ncbi:uncharacterized protein DUF1302 [Zavarzinia compransoris]|nr:uncharacterized protein DUF1302 [Zavarzinia compransoris]